MSTAFTALGLSQEINELLHQNGISEPTPVQRQTIPLLLNGQDVIAQAQTGTGKTLAFALPILERVNVDKEQVQALILTPTRELAIQITAELKKLAPAFGANILAAYGGQDVDAQIRKLQRAPHIVVATPGRLIDHMTRQTISLGKLAMLVLDEADQMLHMGFLPEVESIISQTPRARQTMLFSATMPDAIRRLASEYMNAPSDIQIRSANVTLDSIVQTVVDTTDRGKQRALVQLLEQHNPYLAVIFCRTKIRAKKLNEALQDLGIVSDELHGDLTQAKREQVMKRFRDARLQVLVATDVAARGLDVEGVTHVYNYDCPPDAELYIHRIGRTGRAGQKGVAITLATPYDKSNLAAIEKGINARLEHRSIDHDGQLSASGGGRKEAGRSSAGGDRGAAGSRRSGDGRGRNRGSERTQEGGRGRSRGGESSAEGGRGQQRSNDRGNSRSGQSRGPKQSSGASSNPWEITDADLEFARTGERVKDKKSGRSSGGRAAASSSRRSGGADNSGRAPRGASQRSSGGSQTGRSGSAPRGGKPAGPRNSGRSGGPRGRGK